MAVALEREVRVPTRDAGALTASLYKQHAGELLRFAWHRLGRVEDLAHELPRLVTGERRVTVDTTHDLGEHLLDHITAGIVRDLLRP